MTWSWGLGLIDIRDFKIQQLDGSKNFKKKKKIGLISETKTLLMHHTFLYISLLFLYNVKLTNFMFYGERKQATGKFYVYFWTWIWSLGIQLQECLPTFDKV